MAAGSGWPALIRPLVDAYGPQAVWDAGFDLMGMPATWITEKSEADRLNKFLFSRSKEQRDGDG